MTPPNPQSTDTSPDIPLELMRQMLAGGVTPDAGTSKTWVFTPPDPEADTSPDEPDTGPRDDDASDPEDDAATAPVEPTTEDPA